MSARLIALTGPARSGKTTTALEFEARGFARVRFAGPLKSMLRALGLTEAQVDGTLGEKAEPLDLLCGKSPRQAMQLLGTEWGRVLIGEDIWVNAAMLLVDELLAAGRDVVIDDCRFVNEARAVIGRGGFVFALRRRGDGCESEHVSEAGIPPHFVEVFVNNNRPAAKTADFIEAALNFYESPDHAND